MCPWADHEARSGCNLRRCLTLNQIEVAKLTRQEWIEPASHEQYRSLDGGSAIFSIDLAPIGVVLGVVHPITKELDLHSDGSLVRFQNGPIAICSLQSALRRPVSLILSAAATHCPIESAFQGKCSTGIEHSIKACAG